MQELNLKRLMEDTEGQDLVEYALIVACLALVAIAGTHGVAADVSQMFITVAGSFTSNI